MADYQLIIAVCDHPSCENIKEGLYDALQCEITNQSLPVSLDKSNCLGGCLYSNRVNVTLPSSDVRRYSKKGLTHEGKEVLTPLGEKPLERILHENLSNIS